MRSRKFVATFGLGAAMLIAGCGAARGPAASGDAPGGGPPGDPGLITVRGLACLRQAQVVMHDRLIHPDLLLEAPATAECVDVGKMPHDHDLES